MTKDNFETGLAAYFTLHQKEPELFTNPAKAGYEILVSEPGIRAAESTAAETLRHGGQPVEWSRVGLVYEDQYMRVLRDAVKFPDGTLGTYVRIVAPQAGVPGVAVLPRRHNEVVLVRHFRHATRSWHLEIPRGFGQRGFSSEASARRELLEEVGARAVALVSLGQLHVDTGMRADAACLFFAEVDEIGEPSTEEAITGIVLMTPEKLEQQIGAGELTDAFTIAAYVRARHRGLLGPKA